MKRSTAFAALALMVIAFAQPHSVACGQQQPSPLVSSAASYDSIQAALDANPDQMVYVPARDFLISEKIRIRGKRSGLFGPGRIIQQNPTQPIIEIEDASDAEIRDVTLTRPEGKTETQNEGILAIRSNDLVIDNVRVLNNQTRTAAHRSSRMSKCPYQSLHHPKLHASQHRRSNRQRRLGLCIQLYRRYRESA